MHLLKLEGSIQEATLQHAVTLCESLHDICISHGQIHAVSSKAARPAVMCLTCAQAQVDPISGCILQQPRVTEMEKP